MFLGVSGCVQHQNSSQVEQKVGYADLNYTPTSGAGLRGKSFGMLSMVFETSGRQDQYSRGFSGRGMDRELQYQLAEAYARDLESIITSKGGGIYGPYQDYDEIPFGEKERILMLIEPKLKIQVRSKVSSKRNAKMGAERTEIGTMQATAQGTIKFHEPMTNEVIFVKRINLKVESEPYEYAYKKEQSSSSFIGLIQQGIQQVATTNFEMKDDRQLRRNEVITKLYAQLMKKVDATLHPKEIARHGNEVQRLKQMKRY